MKVVKVKLISLIDVYFLTIFLLSLFLSGCTDNYSNKKIKIDFPIEININKYKVDYIRNEFNNEIQEIHINSIEDLQIDDFVISGKFNLIFKLDNYSVQIDDENFKFHGFWIECDKLSNREFFNLLNYNCFFDMASFSEMDLFSIVDNEGMRIFTFDNLSDAINIRNIDWIRENLNH